MPEFASSVIAESANDPRVLADSAKSPEGFSQQLQCEFIEDPSRLKALTCDWRELWSSIPDATPFQSPDWILPWWDHFAGGPLFSFAFWRESQLVGFAPLYVFTSENLRSIFLIGTGNTDYLGVLFGDHGGLQCARELFAELDARAERWDDCSLQRLRPGSPLLGEHHAPGLLSEVHQQESCMVVDLQGAGASSMLKTARGYRRKLEQKHQLKIEQATEDSLDHLLAALERVHQARWHTKGMSSVLDKENDRDFYHEVARRFLKAGLLRLYALRIDERIADVLYGFQHGKRVYLYLSAFDPKFARMSVGTVLLGHAVQRAMDEGCDYFDFLRGRESYKYRWGAQDQSVFALSIRKKR